MAVVVGERDYVAARVTHARIPSAGKPCGRLADYVNAQICRRLERLKPLPSAIGGAVINNNKLTRHPAPKTQDGTERRS
jgi:UDP-N-acetylenolpyruvoylglucosamine reductase